MNNVNRLKRFVERAIHLIDKNASMDYINEKYEKGLPKEKIDVEIPKADQLKIDGLYNALLEKNHDKNTNKKQNKTKNNIKEEKKQDNHKSNVENKKGTKKGDKKWK